MYIYYKERKKGLRINANEKSPNGKYTCQDSNLPHRFAKQTETTCTIHHAIAPSSKKMAQ